MISSFDGSTLSDSIANTHRINTGASMAGSGGRVTVEACSMADESCNGDLQESQSPDINIFSNMEQAFYLILEALSALKFVSVINFALAFVFTALWIRSYFTESKPRQVRQVRHAAPSSPISHKQSKK